MRKPLPRVVGVELVQSPPAFRNRRATSMNRSGSSIAPSMTRVGTLISCRRGATSNSASVPMTLNSISSPHITR